jgi:uncharacterized membrane protein YfcA
MGKISWLFILPAAVASFAGDQAGARIMSAILKAKSIRIVFSITLFVLCAKLLHQSFLS